MATALVVALIILALIGVIFVAVDGLLRSSSPVAEPDVGVAVRLLCPRTKAYARVRISPVEPGGEPSVVWCERFPAGRLECARECFTALPKSTTVLAAPV